MDRVEERAEKAQEHLGHPEYDRELHLVAVGGGGAVRRRGGQGGVRVRGVEGGARETRIGRLQ